MRRSKESRSQLPREPIFVDDWPLSEDFPTFPVGSKPKRMIICPSQAQESGLIANHAYLFKIAEQWQTYQVWSEFLAYRLSIIAGLKVPPAFIAVHQETGETGVLLEFFYGYPDEENPAQFIPASEFLRLKDPKVGRPHDIQRNLILTKFLAIQNAPKWWAKTLVFDALIGNTDRHPENWGILVRRKKRRWTTGLPSAKFSDIWRYFFHGIVKADFSLSPRFDNATSLGYEQLECNFHKFDDASYLERYISRGCHHCSWDMFNDMPAPHFDLCKWYRDAYPSTAKPMLQLLDFDMQHVTNLLEQCVSIDAPVPLTDARANFIWRLIDTRRKKLIEVLNG